MRRAAVLLALAWSGAGAQSGPTLPARITGPVDGATGRCSVAVRVDGSVMVGFFGSDGWLDTLSGKKSLWLSLECTKPIPQYLAELKVVSVQGRGTVTLTEPLQPRFRIDDPLSGPGEYRFVFEWKPVIFWSAEVVAACQKAVRERARRYYGLSVITFGLEREFGGNGGPAPALSGAFALGKTAGRRFYPYSCRTDLDTGRIRWVSIEIWEPGTPGVVDNTSEGGWRATPSPAGLLHDCREEVVRRLSAQGWGEPSFDRYQRKMGSPRKIVEGTVHVTGKKPATFRHTCVFDPDTARIQTVELKRLSE